jgi:hypothetical protein
MSMTAFGRWAGLAIAVGATLAILGFYVARLAVPLPIYPVDEVVYLVRALYSDPVVAVDPTIAVANDGVHLSIIRAVYELGAPVVLGDRAANVLIYLAGLALIWREGAKRLPRFDQVALGLLLLGFPYYRFAFSNLAEGPFVGTLALICAITVWWGRRRPILHAAVAGALAAVLVLIKANGVATLAALAAMMAWESFESRRWKLLPVRLGLLATAFLVLGNLIQYAADEPVANPITFFVSHGYAANLTVRPPEGAWRSGALEAAAMIFSTAMLAGAPLVAGFRSLFEGAAKRPHPAKADGMSLAFLLLALSLAATIVMVGYFAMQVAGSPTETKRLWGRYFEFFIPLLWATAAPQLARPTERRVAWIYAGVTLTGLAGLLLCLHLWIVLFPWDSGILSAFFKPDPDRAPLALRTPYRALAVASVAFAAAAFALRARSLGAGLGMILALGVLSTALEDTWTRPMIAQHRALDRDLRVIAAALPRTGSVVLLTPDANLDHLVFLRLDARPRVYPGALADAPADAVVGAAAVLTTGAQPAQGTWTRTFKGEQLSLFRPTSAP